MRFESDVISDGTQALLSIRRIAKGDPKYVLGKSGIEIALEVVEQATGKELAVEQRISYARSPEYWMGWALARRSGVSLRSIQMYEQRNKNINKASAETLYRLAKVFSCSVEDLLEH